MEAGPFGLTHNDFGRLAFQLAAKNNIQGHFNNEVQIGGQY